ncbi:MAG: thiopurine S-methyltransferase [Nitrospinae bacterium]|nr:thiopurine S-methyltransferase [Nitrospinota bacterium]
MDAAFWLERWERNQIGFHQEQVNSHLQEFWKALALPDGAPVFVPLCGKSRDLLWLRGQGHPVTGVEISPRATEAFFAENRLTPTVTRRGDFVWAEADGVTLLTGDFFDLTPASLGPVAGVYDRASLIALPPAMRTRYADHLVRLVDPATPLLLVSLDYPEAEMNGPPFPVREEEVRRLYERRRTVSLLYTCDALPENPAFADRGVTRLTEKVYRLGPLSPNGGAS